MVCFIFLFFTIVFCFPWNIIRHISISYILNRYRFPAPSSRFGERTNQTLKTAMGKSLDWYQEGWENNLKVILFAHNSSIQASTEYGREPQLSTEVNNA